MRFLKIFLARHRRSSDRGVTVIEYGLIIGSVLVGSLSSIGALDSSIERNYVSTADEIGQPNLAVHETTTTSPGGPPTTTAAPSTTTSTTSTTTAPPSTTTTAPPSTTTTAPPSTTTTAPPSTTTTAPPSTTTTAPPQLEDTSITYKDRSDLVSGGYRAKIRLIIDDGDGNDLSGATVQVEFTLDDGSTQTATGVANSFGKITFKWAGLSGSDFDVEVRVLSITANGTDYDPGSDVFILVVPVVP